MGQICVVENTPYITYGASGESIDIVSRSVSCFFGRRRRLTQFPTAEIAKSVSTATLQIKRACLYKSSAPLVTRIKSAFRHSMDSFIVLTALFKM